VQVGVNPDLQVQRALPAGGFLTRGAFEGVVAAGGEVDGAFAQAHGVLDGHDLQAGDGGEAGFFLEAASVTMHRLGKLQTRTTLASVETGKDSR
jgi:hypothetical protein